MKLELVLTKELFQSGCELAAEDAAECADRKEEASGRRKPSGAIGSETAGRNNVMYVWMMLKVLSPSVEHAKKPDVCTQVLGVAGQFRAASLHWLGTEDDRRESWTIRIPDRSRARTLP